MEEASSLQQEQEQEDGLEIISIGALYRGHWEKKYWSSSRGNDRYPYPVGYHASRIHAGTRCKMQVGEGPTGPLFMVGPTDGDLCVGLTPDLAWESFHKKSTPKPKNWQGRRFSSKIDGTELFGFKNKVVRRLLRQLVAASSGSPQEQISSSSVEQISSSTIKPNETLGEKTCPNNNDIHPTKFVYSRKRSVKLKTEESKVKKKHHEFLVDHNHMEGPIGTGTIIKESLPVLADSQKENRGDKESPLAEGKDELEMKAGDIEIVGSILQNVPFEAENSLGSSKNENDDLFKTVPDSPVDSQNYSALKFVHPEKDVSINEVERTQEDVSINEVVKDSQTSNLSSQRTDEDSEKQDLTRSMMEFLLPQAVPLLKERYTRKRFKSKNRGNISISWAGNDHPIEDDIKAAKLKTEAMNQESKEKTVGLTFLCDMVKTKPEHFDASEEEVTCVIEDSYEDNSNQKNDSSKSSPDTKGVVNLQNNIGEAVADSFEDYSNQKIDSGKSSPDTKGGANLQNDLREEGILLSDSFLAGLEEEFRAIENEAILKKTNNVPHANITAFGPYQHPEPVLSLTLSSRNNCLEICILCGESNTCERSLYIYNLVSGQPCFVGYTSMFINSAVEVEPPSKENLRLGRAGLQYISEEGLLAFIPSIKTPYCSKMCINCSCSICKLEQGEENALKLVRVDLGFVVAVTKMKTNEKVSSILVCKPNYVIAVEGPRLHVWVMSSTWRAVSDEFALSTLENVVPSKMEVEQVQESNALLLGHDGFGGFCLWDISKRVLLAKFQASNSIISKIIPLSCFNINKTEFSDSNQNIKLCVRDIPTNNPMPLGENCLAIWLLVSSCTVPECQTDLKARNQRWRLALLAKDTLFMGHILDSRISVMDAYANYGFAGTHDGFYYKWDLYSGTKLAWMDCFSSGSVSFIAVDPKSGAVAVADDENQVLIYTQRN